MPIVATIFGLAALMWGAVYARRGSLLVGCGLVLILAYVLGHTFWHAKIGPVPITLDRLALVGLLAAVAVAWRRGRWRLRPLTAADWMLIATLGVLALSAATSGRPEASAGEISKWGRFAASFLIPTALYFVVRQLAVSPREWLQLLLLFTGLGVYLAGTGVLEVAGWWSLVFPRYLVDPSLGIHFGRARGPELNSVSLGCTLVVTLCCAWTLARRLQSRWQQLVLLLAMPLMVLAILLTFTRSTWIGLAASALVLAAAEIPRRLRLPAVGAAAVTGLLLSAASWGHLLGVQREGTAAESSHSVSQRASFAYVSWQMFRESPVLGVGFGRFYDRKLPYLSDRTQPIELESLRSLQHHNTLLSLLTETGLIGLGAFLGLLVLWTRSAWRLAVAGDTPVWIRAQGVLLMALVVNYLSSALFHDLTHLPSQQMVLFLFAGLTVNLRQQAAHCVGHQSASRRDVEAWQHAGKHCDGAPVANGSGRIAAAQPAYVGLFGMRINRITLEEAVARVLHWCEQPHGVGCRYVVTPNVDHAVLLQDHHGLRAAYSGASLVLADGAPIVAASRLLGRPLPERVAGSDLVPSLFSAARGPLRVFLLGAGPGVADAAAARIEQQWRHVRVVDTYSPPMGFENDDAENERIIAAVADAAPDLLVVGLGAPKQELWVHRHRDRLRAKVVICAGATIDFLAGHRHRSPVWMRRAGLEWLHRVYSEPRRLAGRYSRDAWVFPQLVYQEWRSDRR